MLDELRKFLQKYFRVDDIDPDANILDMGYVNSLFSIQLISFMEKEMHITVDIEDMDIDNFSTLNNIMNFVIKKQANSEP